MMSSSSARLGALAALALGVAACGPSAPEPQGEATGAAMPDTSMPGPNPPDAGAAGLAPGQAPAADQAEQQAQDGAGLPPVDLPNAPQR